MTRYPHQTQENQLFYNGIHAATSSGLTVYLCREQINCPDL